MFQNIHKKNRQRQLVITNSPIKDEEIKLLQINTNKSSEELSKSFGNRDDENNQSQDSFKRQDNSTKKSVDLQVSVSKDLLSKDAIMEENDNHSEQKQSNKNTNKKKQENQSNYQSQKKLQGLDYIRFKLEQSREKGEYFDMGGDVYKNYKYERVKLQKPELTFLQNKPFDLIGCSLYSRKNIENYINIEKAKLSQKRQKDIDNLGQKNLNESILLRDNNVYHQIRQKIQGDIISSQLKDYPPFETQKKITKGLAKLEQHIKYKNNSSGQILLTLPQSTEISQDSSLLLPSIYSAKGSGNISSIKSPSNMSLRQNTKLNSSQSVQSINNSAGGDRKWLSPLVKYENIDSIKYKSNKNEISKTDLILKNELLREGQPDPSSMREYEKLKRNQNKDKEGYLSNTDQEEDFETDGVCLSVINFNKAFKGRGKKMHSLIEFEDKNHNKNKPVWEIAKSFNKKSQYLLVVEEFNRLLQKDRIDKARTRTKKIKTQIDKKIDDTQFENKLVTHDHCISQEIFLKETFFFHQYIRSEPNIRERILYGISNLHNGIDFESYLKFYQIFVFQTTPFDALLQFVCKYFIYNKGSRLAAVTLEQFLESLRQIVNHPMIQDRDQCYQNWESNLQELKQITYDPNFLLKMNHLEVIFKQFAINPNLILKLLFN